MRTRPGKQLTVVKADAAGRIVARYSGRIEPALPGWIAVSAAWTRHPMTSGPLRFEPGDRLIEYFSFLEPLNAFAVYGSDARFKGWYANVACPAVLVDDELWWRDLYIDVVTDAAGAIVILDEEELEASGLQKRDPDGYACITAARDRLLTAIQNRLYPFDRHSNETHAASRAEGVQSRMHA
ncbi:MAG: DUF402 domain-containing protein [Thermomicrobium sp.]|nr:DUF402 domain-containing protein [Thermomicrobium sp.]MDW7981367.1 DUF402 domain-containing protein [Thermomicrobium sp.]